MSADEEAAQTGIELGAKLDLHAALGKLAEVQKAAVDGLEKIHKFLTENPIQGNFSRKLTIVKNAGAPAPTYMYIDMGGPPDGFIWDVRRYVITGADPTSAVTGTLWSFIGPAPQDGATQAGSYSDLVDASTTTIPNAAKWSKGQLTLVAGEHFILALKGLGNNQQIVASMQVQQWREDGAAVRSA